MVKKWGEACESNAKTKNQKPRKNQENALGVEEVYTDGVGML
jgi:hypothetical protein